MDPVPRRPEPGAQPRLVAWEVTRSCNLNCVHCRASSDRGPYPGELGTAECMDILMQIRDTGVPIVILTGGEPLLRDDIFLLADKGTELGLRMVMATNGTLLKPETVAALKEAGIKRVSISMDAHDAETHDRFRNVPGAFARAVEGARFLREGNLEFQINTTVTRHNKHQVDEIARMAVNLGAAALHLFLLVPTGRAREMVSQEIEAEEYEKVLTRLCDMRDEIPLHLKATCAPHYYRILRQEAKSRGLDVTFATHGLDAVTRGCLGGTSFCFVSHDGIVQPCGYLEVPCGDLKEKVFGDIWRNSEVFGMLRDFKAYKGKCGKCRYVNVCGGCRARAFEATGDFLEEEPLCSYQPERSGPRNGPGGERQDG